MDNVISVAAAPLKKYKKKSQFIEIWGRLKRNKTAIIGLVTFGIIILFMIFADVIVNYNVAIKQNIPERMQPPSMTHFFGTDDYGRDIFARIVHATRNSLLMGIGGVIVGVIFGGILAGAAGYYGGKVDAIIMRIVDTIICIPFLLLALAIVAALGPGLVNVMIALMLGNVPTYTRIFQSVILTLVDQDYIEAARACGTPDRYIILKHILPNAIGTIIVQATMSVGSMIIAAASLSFIGMGIQPPTPEWGQMLSEGKAHMMQAAYIVIFPGMAISLTALSLNLMGDGLRDALDPRLKD